MKNSPFHFSSNIKSALRDPYDLSLIGRCAGQYSISLDCGIANLANPYFRFYSQSERRNDIPSACISFLVPRYINNPFIDDSFRLSPELKQTLMDFLTASYSPYDGCVCTRWQYMLAKYNWENIVIVNWYTSDWLKFTSEKKKKVKNVPSRIRYALPCDFPMPNYLELP